MNLPDQYDWLNIDAESKEDLLLIYKFLYDNYVDDTMFRIHYTIDTLQWFLTAPGYHKEWHVAMQLRETNQIIGFVAGIPINLNLDDETKKMAEINFLCIHKNFRNKSLAPILINEVTNRCIEKNINQAIYTIGKVINKAFSASKYWHRILNYRKLVEIGFYDNPTCICEGPTFDKYIHYLDTHNPLNKKAMLKNLREMQEKDISIVCQLLNNYNKKIAISTVFNDEETKHWFLPKAGVVYSYVLEDENKNPTDFISFYKVKNTVLRSKKYDNYDSANIFYYAINTVEFSVLMNSVLCIAKKMGFDVFTACDIMDNKKFLLEKSLNFGPGTGILYYYFYNYKQDYLDSSKIGIPMI